MSTALRPVHAADIFTLAGADVALAARRPSVSTQRDVLVAYLDRTRRPTGRYAECFAHELRGPSGVHMAELKRRIAALPLATFAFDLRSPERQPPADRHPRAWLHAHHAVADHDR